jgi:hypothetical protein
MYAKIIFVTKNLLNNIDISKHRLCRIILSFLRHIHVGEDTIKMVLNQIWIEDRD